MLELTAGMTEKIIVSLTSYGKRIAGIPLVLDTIVHQTIKPDQVVLNLAFEESLTPEVREYLQRNNIEVNRVPDTKVYKKLIPTLRKYPNACVISIDDDFLYPNTMVSDFVTMHQRYPDNPLSGNRVVYAGMQCHCGCASLTKASYFDDYLFQVDDEVIRHCPSDDLLYTYFATKAGHPYMQTDCEYFKNMTGCNNDAEGSYSQRIDGDKGLEDTMDFLIGRFGPIGDVLPLYVQDAHVAKVIRGIQQNELWEMESRIRSSRKYRLGKFLLSPLSWLKNR